MVAPLLLGSKAARVAALAAVVGADVQHFAFGAIHVGAHAAMKTVPAGFSSR